MGLLTGDLKLYGSAIMPDDNTGTQVGGAISLSRTVSFADVAGLVQAVSEQSSDTQTVTVYYKDATGALLNEAHALTGQTPVAFAATMARLLKAIKAGSTAGAVAVEAQTATRQASCGGVSLLNTLVLDASASNIDQAYTGQLVRIVSGGGAGQIRQILYYSGSTRTAIVDFPWAILPDTSSTFRIASGFYFAKFPSEILEVRRPFYNAAANAPGGGAVSFYDLVYFKNTHPSLTAAAAAIRLLQETSPNARINFGLGAAVNTAYDNGVGNNRLVAPMSVTFARTDVAVPAGSLTPGSYIACWLQAALLDGDAAENSFFIMTPLASATDVTTPPVEAMHAEVTPRFRSQLYRPRMAAID